MNKRCQVYVHHRSDLDSCCFFIDLSFWNSCLFFFGGPFHNNGMEVAARSLPPTTPTAAATLCSCFAIMTVSHTCILFRYCNCGFVILHMNVIHPEVRSFEKYCIPRRMNSEQRQLNTALCARLCVLLFVVW